MFVADAPDALDARNEKSNSRAHRRAHARLVPPWGVCWQLRQVRHVRQGPRWRASLAERGLVLHVPPDPLASIHNPGSTLFVVVTLAGGAVRWLPEQDGRLVDLWKVRRAGNAAPWSAVGRSR
jgi:hypothetical protein